MLGVLLKAVQRGLQSRKIRNFKRRMPFGELLTERSHNADQCGFGAGSTMYDSAIVFFDKDGTPPKVGKNTWIGPNVILDNSGGGLEIGENCTIGSGTQIYTHDSVQWATRGGMAAYEYSPAKIGNNCFLGPMCVIARGVTIGDGCTIGAMSFVNRDVPSGAKAFGNPAKVTEVSQSA